MFSAETGFSVVTGCISRHGDGGESRYEDIRATLERRVTQVRQKQAQGVQEGSGQEREYRLGHGAGHGVKHGGMKRNRARIAKHEYLPMNW